MADHTIPIKRAYNPSVDQAPSEKQKATFVRKIETEWIPEILALAAQLDENGKPISQRKICEELKRKYGVEVTAPSISRTIKKAKMDRADTTQATIRDHIAGYIVSDLDILTAKKNELVILSDNFKAEKDWKNYYLAIDRIKAYSEMLMDLAGANVKQNDSEIQEAKQSLYEKMEEAIKKKSE